MKQGVYRLCLSAPGAYLTGILEVATARKGVTVTIDEVYGYRDSVTIGPFYDIPAKAAPAADGKTFLLSADRTTELGALFGGLELRVDQDDNEYDLQLVSTRGPVFFSGKGTDISQ